MKFAMKALTCSLLFLVYTVNGLTRPSDNCHHDDNCFVGEKCNRETSKCVQCLENSDCSTGWKCEESKCKMTLIDIILFIMIAAVALLVILCIICCLTALFTCYVRKQKSKPRIPPHTLPQHQKASLIYRPPENNKIVSPQPIMQLYSQASAPVYSETTVQYASLCHPPLNENK